MFRAAFPDLAYVAEEGLAEGDLVATRFSATGTHRGTFLGVAPTGRRVAYSGIDINRVQGGRIVESWVHYDALGLLQQLGIVEPIAGM
jgi:predicted ester cyclase